MKLLAPIKWAQRKDSLYVTIALPDVKNEKVQLDEDALKFSGMSNGKEYQHNVEFLHAVDPKESTWKVLPHSVQMHIAKKVKDADFWTSLPKNKALEKNGITIDWTRYVDEDEEEDAGGFDMSALAGGGGFGGMDMGGFGSDSGGDDSGEDSHEEDDDDEMPELETTEASKTK